MGILNYTWEASGQAAFQSLVNNPVHLVISDYNMPNGTGIDLLRAIREHAPVSKTGVIIVTGSPDQRILQAGTTLGLNNYIKKPFTTLQMKQCIETVTGPL
jgi:two-component system chemotaxis response regulator CheY